MIGATVSHYRILEKIGEGGMGTVYLATDDKLKRPVALKFVREALTEHADRRERFVREARAAAAIEHPNIAAVHDIDEHDGRTFIVMEYVKGLSLRDVIPPDGMSLDDALTLIIPVAEALSKAHENGVVHRDVKPENILVAHDGYPKLLDFGLAKLLECSTPKADSESATAFRTADGLVIGTAAYMSPEGARGESVDPRTDVFSLGIVFHEMLTGRSPFQRDTAVESMNAVLNEDPPRAGDEATSRILGRALAKEPSERYPSAKELARDLSKLRSAVPVRPRSFVWNGVVAALLVAAALATYALMSMEGDPPGVGVSGRPSVAILYFENNSGEEEIRWLTKGLPSMLLTDLAQTPGLDVVSSQRVHEILNQVGPDNVASINRSVAAEVARRSGAGAVVMGSIFKAGDEIRIDVQVEDIESGRVLSAASVRGTEVFPLVDEITGRIRSSLRVPEVETERPLTEISTHSIEAYRLYVEGRDAATNLREADARRLYEEALRRDPNFAMVHFDLSLLMRNWSPEAAISEAHKEAALRNVDRLSNRERLVVESRYAQLNDIPRAIRLAEELISNYPDEVRGYRLLSQAHRLIDSLAESLEALERGVAANPASSYLQNYLGYELLYSDRPEDALVAFRAYEALDPEEANPYDSQGEAYLLMAQPENAIERFDRALEIDPSFNPVRYPRIWANAMLGRYEDALDEVEVFSAQAGRDGFLMQFHMYLQACLLSRAGRYADASERMARGALVASEGSDFATGLEFSLLAAWFALERDDYDEVLANTRRVVQDAPRVDSVSHARNLAFVGHLLGGAADARRGRLDAARARIETLEGVRDPNDTAHTFWYYALEGEIALASDDAAAAKEAFLAMEPGAPTFFDRRIWAHTMYSNNLPFRDGLARAELALGDLPAAIERYRALLAPEETPFWRSWLEPRHVLALGRLLDDAGDADGARAEYERFLRIWKDADEGLPELEEARAALVTTTGAP